MTAGANRLRDRLLEATGRLGSVSDSPRLDAELLMAHCLKRDRAWLLTWPDHVLDELQQACFDNLLQRRLAGEPVAYLLGEREFWSLRLRVTPATLVPRAETELLVERALTEIDGRPRPRVLELGTGSGAIALALKQERPDAEITATDISASALEVARENAARLGLALRLLESDWYNAIDPGERFDLVVSNPPYIAAGDPWLSRGDLPAEPQSALCSGPSGLEALERIIAGAPVFLRAGAALLFEHGYDQLEPVQQRLREAGFEQIETWTDFNELPRVSRGLWTGKGG